MAMTKIIITGLGLCIATVNHFYEQLCMYYFLDTLFQLGLGQLEAAGQIQAHTHCSKNITCFRILDIDNN